MPRLSSCLFSHHTHVLFMYAWGGDYSSNHVRFSKLPSECECDHLEWYWLWLWRKVRVRKMSDPRPLYVSRPLINAGEFMDWALSQGFKNPSPMESFHTTIAYSKTAVDWDRFQIQNNIIRVSCGQRSVVPLGDKGAVVLKFRCPFLSNRWKEFTDGGCSWDWPTYQPHVTITYQGADVDLTQVHPFTKPLVFGPEVFAVLNPDWKP